MKMNHLVFIEGVSGVGKTTTTPQVAEQLQRMGYKVRHYAEGANDNPLDPFGGVYPPDRLPITAYCETYMQCWQTFMKATLEHDMIIVDGTLLHHQINDLIRAYDAPNEVIADYLADLLRIIQPLHPVIFYLSSHHVGQRLIQARKSRGQSVPTRERITFWEHRKSVDLFVLDRLPVESHRLEVDKGWDLIPGTIVQHIIK